MTKYILIAFASRFLAASASYDPMKLDIGKNIESCVKKVTQATIDACDWLNCKETLTVGSCDCTECKTIGTAKQEYCSWKECLFPIHKERVSRNYGQNGIEGSQNVKSLLVTGKTLNQCRSLVGQAVGFKGCNVMYAAYLCKAREACDDGDCQTFCGFYPEITDGVTLQSFYPKVSGSAQGAWGFVEAGIRCAESTPGKDSPQRTSPHDSCNWVGHKTASGADGDQSASGRTWGADNIACCNVWCNKENCGEGKWQARQGMGMMKGLHYYPPFGNLAPKDVNETGCCEKCPGYPTTPCEAPPRIFQPMPWTVWKTYSKCKKTADFIENRCAKGNIGPSFCSQQTLGGSRPSCMGDNVPEGHDFVVAKMVGEKWETYVGEKWVKGKTHVYALDNECYSVKECVEFETGLKDKWVILTRRSTHSLQYMFEKPSRGAKCSAFNTKDCADGLICDNTKDPASPGEGVCVKRSENVTGNGCVVLPAKCDIYHRCLAANPGNAGLRKCRSIVISAIGYYNCQVENLMQCSLDSACSLLAYPEGWSAQNGVDRVSYTDLIIRGGGHGKCEACDKVFDVKKYSKVKYGKLQFPATGCNTLWNGMRQTQRSGGAEKSAFWAQYQSRCAAMQDICPSIGKCFTSGGNGPEVRMSGDDLGVCYPAPKYNENNCAWHDDKGDCWACAKGYAAAWTSNGKHAGNWTRRETDRRCPDKWQGPCTSDQGCSAEQAVIAPGSVDIAAKCDQCPIKCESGFSYALTGGIGKERADAPLPKAVQYDCPAGYVRINSTRLGLKSEGKAKKLAKDAGFADGLVIMHYTQGCCKQLTTTGRPTTTTSGPSMKDVLGQVQVTTFKDLDFAKMTDLLKTKLVATVCRQTLVKNGFNFHGHLCTGVVSKGSVVVTTKVRGIKGKLKNADVGVVLEAVKAIAGLQDAVVAGKTLDTMAPVSIADSVPFVTEPTTTAAPAAPAPVMDTTSLSLRALPLPMIALLAALGWQCM